MPWAKPRVHLYAPVRWRSVRAQNPVRLDDRIGHLGPQPVLGAESVRVRFTRVAQTNGASSLELDDRLVPRMGSE